MTIFSVARLAFVGFTLISTPSYSQFLDPFDRSPIKGWFTGTGDGTPTLELEQREGFLRYKVDARNDQHGVWWTFIKRDISKEIDVKKLADPRYELRVEARVRGSHAPRRVNFMINTQRTTDFHEHLREFEISNTSEWHTISMTTQNFDVRPGDSVFVQFCVTDWGPGEYFVDIDYYRADVVRKDRAAPDVGEPLIYHPLVPEISTFSHHVPVAHDSIVSTQFPNVNFNDWHVIEGGARTNVLTVSAAEWPVLRWDLSDYQGAKAAGAGVLELTTHSLASGGQYAAAFGQDLGEEFGKVRIIEILGSTPDWDQATVTYGTLTSGAKYEDVFNTQMIIDLELAEERGGKAYFTLPRPVMQRLLDGTTKGLLIRPLGAMAASIYASEQGSDLAPKLHFTLAP